MLEARILIVQKFDTRCSCDPPRHTRLNETAMLPSSRLHVGVNILHSYRERFYTYMASSEKAIEIRFAWAQFATSHCLLQGS